MHPRWCSLLLVLMYSTVITSSEKELELLKHLLDDYEVNRRPVRDFNNQVVISMDLVLNQIIFLNERDQILSGNYWVRLNWKDEFLVWNRTEYDNISVLHISVASIWKPDITIVNDVSVIRRDVEKHYPAQVSYDGNVTWNFPKLYQSYCDVDVTYFPWDSQNCTLKFGSWSYTKRYLDIVNHSHSGNMDYFIKNGVLEFAAFPVHRIEEELYPDVFPSLVYDIIVSRKALYYLINIISPCILINFSGMLVFLLPPDSGEKLSLAMTVLLSATFFLLLVAAIVPVQSDTFPLMSGYFMSQLLLLVLNTIVSVLVVNIHHRGDFGALAPKCLRVLMFKYLAPPVFMRENVERVLGYELAFHEDEEEDDNFEIQEPEEMAASKVVNIWRSGILARKQAARPSFYQSGPSQSGPKPSTMAGTSSGTAGAGGISLLQALKQAGVIGQGGGGGGGWGKRQTLKTMGAGGLRKTIMLTGGGGGVGGVGMGRLLQQPMQSGSGVGNTVVPDGGGRGTPVKNKLMAADLNVTPMYEHAADSDDNSDDNWSNKNENHGGAVHRHTSWRNANQNDNNRAAADDDSKNNEVRGKGNQKPNSGFNRDAGRNKNQNSHSVVETMDRQTLARYQWNLIGVILDRWFLVIFSIATVAASLTLLLAHPKQASVLFT